MSIYRQSVCPRSDVYALEIMKQSLAAPRITPRMSVEAERYAHLRKAAPANIPLRRTLVWVESLPPEARPSALLRRFARIANLIAAAWPDGKTFHAYMESLLTDHRGNRQGFPPDVLEDLVALQRYRYAVACERAWDAVGKRG